MKTQFKEQLLENKQLELEAVKLIRELQDTTCGIGLKTKCYIYCKFIQDQTVEKQIIEKMQLYCDNILTTLDFNESVKSEEHHYITKNLKKALEDHLTIDNPTLIDNMFRQTRSKVFMLMRDIMYCDNISYAYGATFKNRNINTQIWEAIREIEKTLKN